MKRFVLICYFGLLVLVLPCFGEMKWGIDREEALKNFGKNYEISDCGRQTTCYTYKNVQNSDILFNETGLRFLDNKLISWYGASDVDSETALDIMKKFEQKYGMKFDYIEEGGINRMFYKNNEGEVYVFLMKEELSYYFTVYYKSASEIRLEAEKETDQKGNTETEKIRRDI
jgi:hypothetical protein